MKLNSATSIIKHLRQIADPAIAEQKVKQYNITATNAIGVKQTTLNALTKQIPKDKKLALELYKSGIYEARLLCAKIFPVKELTESLMEKWVKDFDNWAHCDSFCMNLFKYSPLAYDKAFEWADRSEEFQKRAGLVLMTTYGFANKKAGNEVFMTFVPVLIRESTDNRVYVKKAVSWALRQIGKRNIDLKKEMLKVAWQIGQSESPAAQWIAKDVLRELESDSVKSLDYPRSVYRL